MYSVRSNHASSCADDLFLLSCQPQFSLSPFLPSPPCFTVGGGDSIGVLHMNDAWFTSLTFSNCSLIGSLNGTERRGPAAALPAALNSNAVVNMPGTALPGSSTHLQLECIIQQLLCVCVYSCTGSLHCCALHQKPNMYDSTCGCSGPGVSAVELSGGGWGQRHTLSLTHTSVSENRDFVCVF